MIDRYKQALEYYSRQRSTSADQLMEAICLTKLERYADAKHSYGSALRAMLKDRWWHKTSQPDWLVNTYELAGEGSLYSRVLKEIEDYKLDDRGSSLVAFYAYATIRLVASKDDEAREYVPKLLARPKVKDTFAAGKVIETILEQSQPAFDAALDGLLKAHRGMAKFGDLRESPEGFLSLWAMLLAKIALQRGLLVDTESEYLSKAYLDYLLADQSSGRRFSG